MAGFFAGLQEVTSFMLKFVYLLYWTRRGGNTKDVRHGSASANKECNQDMKFAAMVEIMTL